MLGEIFHIRGVGANGCTTYESACAALTRLAASCGITGAPGATGPAGPTGPADSIVGSFSTLSAIGHTTD